jgi:hypothetical protein
MDGWTDGRMEEWMDGWMDRWTDGRMDGRTDKKTNGRTHCSKDQDVVPSGRLEEWNNKLSFGDPNFLTCAPVSSLTAQYVEVLKYFFSFSCCSVGG